MLVGGSIEADASAREQVLELGRDPGRSVHGVRHVADRHLVRLEIRPERMPHPARHRSVELGHAIRLTRRTERERRQAKALVVRCVAELEELLDRNSTSVCEPCEVLPRELGVETLVPRLDRCMCREDGRATHELERLCERECSRLDQSPDALQGEERSVSLVQMEHARLEPER